MFRNHGDGFTYLLIVESAQQHEVSKNSLPRMETFAMCNRMRRLIRSYVCIPKASPPRRQPIAPSAASAPYDDAQRNVEALRLR
jgi:hypothetical protein